MSKPVMVISGTRKGIGHFLAEHYVSSGWSVVGCSRKEPNWKLKGYRHLCLDVADERAVKQLFTSVRNLEGRLDAVINNAGIASMNHSLLTPLSTVKRIFATNVFGTFLFCREGARLMKGTGPKRIINFTTVATPLRLEGEAIYAASKASVESITQILAREFAEMGIRVNAVGPTPVQTDLVKHVPQKKMDDLLLRQAIRRWGTMEDVTNVVDFFLKPESDFITGQVIYLGGING
jgi:3-oxoacyl-[acyl-carrier protein] reductase